MRSSNPKYRSVTRTLYVRQQLVDVYSLKYSNLPYFCNSDLIPILMIHVTFTMTHKRFSYKWQFDVILSIICPCNVIVISVTFQQASESLIFCNVSI